MGSPRSSCSPAMSPRSPKCDGHHSPTAHQHSVPGAVLLQEAAANAAGTPCAADVPTSKILPMQVAFQVDANSSGDGLA